MTIYYPFYIVAADGTTLDSYTIDMPTKKEGGVNGKVVTLKME